MSKEQCGTMTGEASVAQDAQTGAGGREDFRIE